MRTTPGTQGGTLVLVSLTAAAWLAVALALTGCRCSTPRDEPSSRDVQPSKTTPPAASGARCSPHAAAPALLVGSLGAPAKQDDVEGVEEGEGPELGTRGAVEFARAALDGATFLLGLANHGADTHALVAVLEDGGARLLDLGRIDPNAEPPRVAARGGHYLALVTDVSAGISSLRLMGISRGSRGLETRLGPEFRKGARDPAGADVAVLASGQALVVWDRSSALGSAEIVGLPVDARSLREKGAPLSLTRPDRSASEPRLVAGALGYWLLWLEEVPAVNDAPAAVDAVDAGLLVEPPSVLWVRELDVAGHPRGEAVAINPNEPGPLVFDARVLPSGRLLVAHRVAPLDRPGDDQPTSWSLVLPGATAAVTQPESTALLGPGAPSLLGLVDAEVSWLAIEDTGGTTALLRLPPEGEASSVPVAGLLGRIALAGDPGRLLTAEPRGIGVELQIQTCAVD